VTWHYVRSSVERVLAFTALVTWLVAGLLGLNLLLVWLRGDGARAGRSHMRPAVLYGHTAFALAVPVLLVAYLLADRPGRLAWTTVAVTTTASILGAVLFLPWWLRRRRGLKARAAARAEAALVPAGAPAGRSPAPPGPPADVLPVERRFSSRVVFTHGFVADLTLALIVLVALLD
jgi:hypothetical protein